MPIPPEIGPVTDPGGREILLWILLLLHLLLQVFLIILLLLIILNILLLEGLVRCFLLFHYHHFIKAWCMCTGVICVGVIEAVVVAEPEGVNMLPWVQLVMNERASSVGMESSHEIRVFEGVFGVSAIFPFLVWERIMGY